MESPKPSPVLLPTRDDSCDAHGTYQAINYVGTRWSGCPQCSAEAVQASKAKIEESERAERCATRLRHSGLQGRFEECTFDSFEVTNPAQKKVVDACKQYAVSADFRTGGGLWLIGPPGTGKTHIGSAMVRYIIEERDRSAEIRSGREIIRMLRSTWGNKERGRDWDGRALSEEDMIYDFGNVALLVIDEIGVTFGTDAEHVQLFDVIDLRYKLRRPTVLLSNLPAKGLKEAMGERAYDRLREGATVLPCQWESHRGTPPSRQALEVVR